MSAESYQNLARAGMTALQQGNRNAARDLFQQVIASGKADASVWLAYAHSCDDVAERMRAVDSVLALEPRNLRALIMKADHLADSGDLRAASTYYSAVKDVAPADLPPGLAREVERARVAAKRCWDQFGAYLEERTSEGVRASSRFKQSIDLILGRKQIFLQQPQYYYFPELPQIQFYPREALPFLDHVESAADDIRGELLDIIGHGDEFRPYVEPRKDRPPARETDQMLNNPDWGAFYLWKSGEMVPENAERCPKTMSALEAVPLTRIKGHTPSILFSRLRPHTRIPPHHGFLNARLICHLPLIVPGKCGLRVGNESREVIQDKAWAFDDSIEHEAWNDSDSARIILLFDIWRPELTEIERKSVADMFEAIDHFGGSPNWHE